MSYAHIGLPVADLAKSKSFYEAVLAPLGLALIREKEDSVHFGKDGRTVFYVHTKKAPPGPTHIAFEAQSKEQVDEFFTAGLSAGGTDNGAPGIRENYSPTYYAAFLLDPDGHNVETVFRD